MNNEASFNPLQNAIKELNDEVEHLRAVARLVVKREIGWHDPLCDDPECVGCMARKAIQQECFAMWQPLATAPRDGTKILVCRLGRAQEPIFVWWVEDHWATDCAGDVDGLPRHARGALWHPLPEMP